MLPLNAERPATASPVNGPQMSGYGDAQNIDQNSARAQAKCSLGIDPGLSGGVAFYWPIAPDRVSVEDMPVVAGEVDCATLARRIEHMRPNIAVIERVASRPGQGVCSVFKFGASYGAVLGVLAALQIPIHLVAPATWKRHFKLDSDKERARALALRSFPATSEYFSRKKNHGRAEAALLAAYGAFFLGKGEV